MKNSLTTALVAGIAGLSGIGEVIDSSALAREFPQYTHRSKKHKMSSRQVERRRKAMLVRKAKRVQRAKIRALS
jgi:hypothetical protein